MCSCDPILNNHHIHIEECHIDQSSISRPANTWIIHTYSNDTKYLACTNCSMDYCLPQLSAHNLLTPHMQCQFNRIDILCSKGQPSLSMVFGSSRCMPCTNVHILISVVVLAAGIVLVLVYLLNLTVTTGTNGLIFYANIVSVNDSVFLTNDNVLKPLKVFISFANFDLGIETCFYNGMDGYAKNFLQLFFLFNVIFIAAQIKLISRYSSRILRWTYTISLPTLATLFLLSYTSVLRTVISVLFSFSIITKLPGGQQYYVWSIDAIVPLFGVEFTLLFIACLLLFLVLVSFSFILFTRYFTKFCYCKPLLTVKHFKHLIKTNITTGLELLLF